MKIVYYSETGNTQTMAEYIKLGMEELGKAAELVTVDAAEVEELLQESFIILGCPAVGSEQIDEEYMRPLIDKMGNMLAGKNVALFGSYSWGSGEWLEEWESLIRSYGADIKIESLMVNETPEGEDIERCKAFGRELAQFQ